MAPAKKADPLGGDPNNVVKDVEHVTPLTPILKEVTSTPPKVDVELSPLEVKYLERMRVMEESVPDNGNFFLKVPGRKNGTDNPSDQVLILKAERDSKLAPFLSEDVVITRKGWGIITTNGINVDIRPDVMGYIIPITSGLVEGSPEDKIAIKFGNTASSHNKSFSITPISSEADEKFIEESIALSIEAAKKENETAKKQAADKDRAIKDAQFKRIEGNIGKFFKLPDGEGPIETPVGQGPNPSSSPTA